MHSALPGTPSSAVTLWSLAVFDTLGNGKNNATGNARYELNWQENYKGLLCADPEARAFSGAITAALINLHINLL